MTIHRTPCKMCGETDPDKFVKRTDGAQFNYCRDCRNKRDRVGEKQKRNGIKSKILLITDIHVPDHDRRVWSIIAQVLKVERPNEVIIMGDFLEMNAMNLHGNRMFEAFEDEMKAGRLALDQLKHCAPMARITFLEGNHETRVTRWCEKNAPQLLETLNIPKQLGLAERGIQWVNELEQPIRRGSLKILHGHQLSTSKTFGLPMYFTRRMAERYAEAGCTIVCGHTHKSQVFTIPLHGEAVNGRSYVKGVGLGCGKKMDPSDVAWMHGSVHGQAHEIALACVRADGVTDLHPFTISNGCAVVNGRFYRGSDDAES